MATIERRQTQDEADRQDAAVTTLVNTGWTLNLNADRDGTVYLSRRDKKFRSMTHYCQVEPDGTVQGDI